jgi:hypothetical protein
VRGGDEGGCADVELGVRKVSKWSREAVRQLGVVDTASTPPIAGDGRGTNQPRGAVWLRRGVQPRVPLPLYLALAQDAAGVPAGQQRVGVPEVRPLSGAKPADRPLSAPCGHSGGGAAAAAAAPAPALLSQPLSRPHTHARQRAVSA